MRAAPQAYPAFHVSRVRTRFDYTRAYGRAALVEVEEYRVRLVVAVSVLVVVGVVGGVLESPGRGQCNLTHILVNDGAVALLYNSCLLLLLPSENSRLQSADHP